MFEFQIAQDLKNISLQDVFGLYSAINQANIDKGIAKTQNYIAELNAKAELERLQQMDLWQNYLPNLQGSAVGGFEMKHLLIAGVLIGAGVLAYKLIK